VGPITSVSSTNVCVLCFFGADAHARKVFNKIFIPHALYISL
jgi:hypothetical protein